MSLVLIGVVAAALLNTSTPPQLSDKRAVLNAVVAITTLPPADLSKLAPTAEIDHDSFELALETFLVGLEPQFAALGGSR